MTTFQKLFIGVALVVALVVAIFEVHQNSQLQRQMQMLQRELDQRHQNTGREASALRTSRPVADTLPSDMVINEIKRACAETTWGGREAAFERLNKLVSLADIPQALAFLAQRPGLSGV